MNMLSRFPFKLAALFLVLIAIMGAGSVLLALRIFERRQAEIDQRLNTEVAANMAAEIEPYILASGTGDEVGSIMHYMMVLNPAVEIYLLDEDGTILDYFTSPGPPVVLERVDTRPIDDYLNDNRQLPIYGDNPRRPDERHHFSAAPISLGGDRAGYLYVILRSIGYDEAEMGLQQRYLLQALQTSIFITIPLVGILGLLVFFLATRPLQRLAQTVRNFGSGDYRARSDLAGRDEFGDLARSFNSMADTIVENVQRLRDADRERRELIANLSHDIRNPLTTIQGYLETLSEKDSVLSAADRHRYYEILLRTAGSLPRLVEDLFELSKLENPTVRPQMEPFSLSELVQDVVMQWSSRAADQGISLRAGEPSGLHLVNGNVGLVERVLTNLIRNALTHTPEGGSVTVSLAESDRAVRVEVADTGVGIGVEDQERIFDRFYIGDESRSRSRDGSGLGLAICKRIVELHDGRIGVESSLGEGSTFWFLIPLSGGENSIS
jgi:signal transduction histidine kinase